MCLLTLKFLIVMSVTYKISKCKNPGKNAVQGVNYYSGKAVKTGEYTFADLANDINNSTTVTAADAMAVFRAMKGTGGGAQRPWPFAGDLAG